MNLRTLLILGRVSNLPTVWSNLLAGWLLAETRPHEYMGPSNDGCPRYENLWSLLLIWLGGSFLYVGGMYLNDYCDAAFDTRYCPHRPIPAGKITRRLVGLLALLWFIAGIACFAKFGPVTLGMTLLLVAAIGVYDFHHKDVAWAPILMGACRCLLYLLAASSVDEFYYFCGVHDDWWDNAQRYFYNDYWGEALQVVRYTLPEALPLSLYIASITYIARGESRPSKPTRWPYLLLLLAFILLYLPHVALLDFLQRAHFDNPNEYLVTMAQVLTPCLLLPAWTAWVLIPFWRKSRPSIGRVVSGLLAGIVLLDMIVVTSQAWPFGFLLFPLFPLALLLQRIIPAT